LFQDHSGSAVMTKALRTSFTEQHGPAKYIACKYIICLLIYLFACTLIFFIHSVVIYLFNPNCSFINLFRSSIH